MKNGQKIYIFMLGLMVLFSMLFSGCSGNSTDNHPALSKSEPIKIAVYPWPGSYMWYLVKEKGFFEKRNVDVELVWFPVYSDSIQALSTGKVDANTQTLSDTLSPISKKLKLKAVLVADNSYGGDGIVANPQFKNISDLKGKKVAAELGTVEHFLLLNGMAKSGLKETDVEVTNMTVNDASAAFIAGNLDAAVLYEPFLSNALNSGKGNLIYSSKNTPGLIPDILVFNEELINQRPDDVQKVVDAWFDALAYWQNNQDEAIKLLAEKAEMTEQDYRTLNNGVKFFTIDDNLKAFTKSESTQSLEYTGQKTAAFLKARDLLDSIPDISKMSDESFVKKASLRD